MQVDKKRRLESLLFLYLKSKKKGNQYGKNMKKRPHDFLWRGSQMESKLMPGKEVTQQRTLQGWIDSRETANEKPHPYTVLLKGLVW